MAWGQTLVLGSAAMLLMSGCDSDSSADCVSSDVGEVCVEKPDRQITFSGRGLEAGSEIQVIGPDGEPFVLPVGSDGTFDPGSGALGYLSLFAGTELTFAVSAIDSNGGIIEGELIVST
jgi:hypothetical protein